MTEYTVTWEVNVTAETPKQAAEEALRIQRDRASIATAFVVVDDDAQRVHHVDLLEDNDA